MKIILADDHDLFRDALSEYIQRSDPQIKVYTAKDYHEAMDFLSAQASEIDIVMLDLNMPGMDGLQGLIKMKAQHPDVPVVILSGLAEEGDVQEALKLGAVGYFPKTMPGKDLLQGIHAVLGGDVFTPIDHDTKQILPSYHSDKSEERAAIEERLSLTPREKEVLGYLLNGASNKEIASKIGIQVVTVKLHVRGLCRKLGAKNRTQAALLAQKIGLSDKK